MAGAMPCSRLHEYDAKSLPLRLQILAAHSRCLKREAGSLLKLLLRRAFEFISARERVPSCLLPELCLRDALFAASFLATLGAAFLATFRHRVVLRQQGRKRWRARA